MKRRQFKLAVFVLLGTSSTSWWRWATQRFSDRALSPTTIRRAPNVHCLLLAISISGPKAHILLATSTVESHPSVDSRVDRPLILEITNSLRESKQAGNERRGVEYSREAPPVQTRCVPRAAVGEKESGRCHEAMDVHERVAVWPCA